MALPFAPLAAGATLFGTLLKAGLSGGDDYQQNRTGVNTVEGMSPNRYPYGGEAAAAQGRIGAVQNPWLLSALADQNGIRDMQQQYIADLMAQAAGTKSYSAEEAARGQAMQRGNLQTMANSTRDRFAQQGTRNRSTQELAGLDQNWLLPTQAAMDQEKQTAQDMLTRVLAGQRQQDIGAQDAWRRQRAIGNKQTMAGEDAAYGHRALAGEDQRRQLGEQVNWEAIRAAYMRKD